MKLSRNLFLFLLLLLFVPSVSHAQSSASKSWNAFWTKFSAAVNKKDKEALKALMSSDFEWALDGYTSPDEVIRIMDKYKYWNQFKRSVANGVKVCGYDAPDCFRTKNTARRTKSPNWLLFEFIGGQWKWTRLIGD